MKYTDTDSLVVLDDQSFSKKFKSFRNIEGVTPKIYEYTPIKGDIFIKDGKTKISLEPDNPSWKIEWDYSIDDPSGPPKDKEEIFSDFFQELFFAPNELILSKYMLPHQKEWRKYYVFTKKKFLDQKKKHVFKNIKNLYFYKIAHDFLRPKEEKFTLPKSINTENVELLYISKGQVVDFNTITPTKFPNLKKLILDTKINSKKIPNFKKLRELFYHNYKNLYANLNKYYQLLTF